MFPDFKQDRRQFLGAMAMSLAGSHVSLAMSNKSPVSRATTRIAPPPHQAKHIVAGDLDVAYAESGPAGGPVVLLLHGWPYDVNSFTESASILSARGYRVVMPYVRGFGATRFVSGDTPRNAQQAALAADVIAFMDALKIPTAIIAGFDWGARTANVLAALWPERCTALVAVSGYLVVNREANKRPLPPQAELGWWYQYYFATERGALGYENNRRDFNRLIWKIASPKWEFDEATYARTAESFDNPDHVAIVIHNYRWRQSLAMGETRFDDLEQRLATAPLIGVPTVTIASDFDGAAADGAPYARKYTGRHSHRVLPGIGHNVPQEAPRAFADAIIEAAAL